MQKNSRLSKNPKIDLVKAFYHLTALCYGIKVSALKKIIEIKVTKKHLIGRYFHDTGIFKIHDLKVNRTLSTNY